jgi:hypothetical protein
VFECVLVFYFVIYVFTLFIYLFNSAFFSCIGCVVSDGKMIMDG